jgi:hypothetical protein
MPRLSWNEVRDRAIRFSRNWCAARSERADKQTFYNEFFEVFGLRRASVAAFEMNVRNLQGHNNSIDLLWRGGRQPSPPFAAPDDAGSDKGSFIAAHSTLIPPANSNLNLAPFLPRVFFL